MEGKFKRFPIDELPDEPIQEIVPLTGAAVYSFLTAYKEFFEVFGSWSRIRLWFLHEWVVTTTSKPFNFLDWLKEEAVMMTRDEIIEKFKTIHHTQEDKPNINSSFPYFQFAKDKDEDWGRKVLKPCQFRNEEGERLTLVQTLLKWPNGLYDASTIEAQPFYEDVKTRLSEYLNRIVNGLRRHFELKYKGNEEVFERGTIEPADRTEWFLHVVQEIYVIEMALKVMESLWKCCAEVFNVLHDSLKERDGRFEGENARVLQSRIAFLLTLTVPVVMLVNDCNEKHRDDYEEYYKESFTKFDSRDQGNPDIDQMVQIPVQLPESIRRNCPGDLVYKRKFIGFNVHHSGHLYWKRNLVENGRTQIPWFSIKNTRVSMDLDFFQRRIRERNGIYST